MCIAKRRLPRSLCFTAPHRGSRGHVPSTPAPFLMNYSTVNRNQPRKYGWLPSVYQQSHLLHGLLMQHNGNKGTAHTAWAPRAPRCRIPTLMPGTVLKPEVHDVPGSTALYPAAHCHVPQHHHLPSLRNGVCYHFRAHTGVRKKC